MELYFEKQKKKTERADNINSVDSAQKYPCFKLVFNDNWNDFGYYTWFSLWYLEKSDNNNWYYIGDLKIIHNSESNVYVPMQDSFSELNNDFCSLGLNIEYYMKLLSKFDKEIVKKLLIAMQDCSSNSDVRERFMYNNAYKTSLEREISVEHVLKTVLPLLEEQDINDIYSFKYNFIPPYNREFSTEWNVRLPFDAKNYQRVISIIGENGVGKTQLLSNMLKDLVNDGENFTKTTLLKNILILYSSEFDSYKIEPNNDDYKVKCLSVVQDTNIFDKLLESLNTIIKRGTFLFNGNMDLLSNNYQEILKEQINDDLIDTLFTNEENKSVNNDTLTRMVKEFSTGQLQIFNLITHVYANLHLNSLLILDEPEIHLHPRLITNFFSCLGSLLEIFQSYAIISTHSPLVIRECVDRNVYLMIRSKDNCVDIGRVPFRTFGQDITTLYEQVFCYQEDRTFFYKTIERLSNEKNATYGYIIKELEDNGVQLDFNSRHIIKQMFFE